MTKLRLGQIDTSDIESSVFASANAVNTVQSNLNNVYTSLTANINSVQANVYALTLDTVATNGNTTTQSIEVAGLLSSGDLTVSGPTTLNSNVVINGMIDSVDRIQFNTSIATDTTAGVLAWNADEGTLQFGLNDAASVHVGQDTFYYVKAGEALSRGNVVYASGAVGNSGHIQVSKFYANNAIDERYVVGVMADDVASGEFGYATVIGTIRGLVADGSSVGETWNLGDVLYPSPTNPGGWTKVQPEAPNQAIPIAFITSNSSSNGSIAVRVTAVSYHLGEIHDVQTGTESDGDVLTWVSSNSRWEPATAASDQSNVYNTYLTLSANDYNTYTTLSGLIDTVQDNVSSQTSNTTIVAGGTDLSNTTVFIEAGDGVLLSSNTTSKTLTIATSMSNVTSQTISIDGSANSFTLTKSAANSNMILVMYNGLVQDPARYSISGTTLTLINSAPLIAGANVEVRYFDFFSLPGVSESGGGGGGYTFQGSVSGYTSGGNPFSTNTIDKFSLTSDGNATDVGDLLAARRIAAGQSSSDNGYVSGGDNGSAPDNVIQKFPFSSDGNASDVGDLTVERSRVSGQSSSASGYTSGGYNTSYTHVNTIDKFSFSSDGNASDVGDLTQARGYAAGQSSTASGYASGGITPATVNTIDKFPFSSDANASDVGDLTLARTSAAGQSSDISGYSSGGANYTNIIDKFPFSSDANATDVGDLTDNKRFVTGQSSTVSGYTSGGQNTTPSVLNVIDKFPFSSDGNASDVGDLTQGRYSSAGQQV